MAPVRQAIALMMLACAGCAAHLAIDSPPAGSAPLELRESYYQAHRPEPPDRGQLVLRTRMFESTPTLAQTSLQLHNGALIQHVEDLRPLVGDESEAAQAIDASVEAQGRADVMVGVGLSVAGASLLAGGAMLGTSLLQPGLLQQAGAVDALVWIGGGTLVGGVIAGGVVVAVGMAARDDEEDARTHVFRTLDAALRAKLELP